MNTVPSLSARYSDPRAYPRGVAFLDGQYVPISEAKISVLDNGFLHSDATYDVVHVWDGAFFRLEDHLTRFFESVEKLHMSIPYDRAQVTEILCNCVALSGLRRAYVEFICTRGVSASGSRDPRDCDNRFIAFAIPFGSVANPVQMTRGLHVAISDVVRIPPQSLDPTVKNYHWLDLITALYGAYDQGAETVILIDQNGNVAEGPGFNIFAVCQGQVFTPAHGVLLGITRQTIFDLCEGLKMDCVAQDISATVLCQADEVFVTSTAGGVMPVSKINGRMIGAGGVGPVTEQIKAAYWDLHVIDQHRLTVEYPDPSAG